MAVKELNDIYGEVGRNLDNQMDENVLIPGETGTKTFGAFKFFSGIKKFLEGSAKKIIKGGASVEGGLAVDSLTVSGSDADYGHIGRIVMGQTQSVLVNEIGTDYEIGQITLPKGTWLVHAGGYTPLNYPKEQATKIYIDVGFNMMTTLKYAWNICGLCLLNQETTLKVKLSNWETGSYQASRNWIVYAVQLA